MILITYLLAASIAVSATDSSNVHEKHDVFEKVLVVGNSISKHEPRESLGWSGNWGMAASTESKDYVHLFLSRLAQSQGGKMPRLFVAGGGGGKISDKVQFTSQFIEYKADLAIVQLGENDRDNVNLEGFQKPYQEILQAIRTGNPNAKIICVGVWSPPNGNPTKDRLIKAAGAPYNALFADLSAANANGENRAEEDHRFTHKGVNWHPGDKGMEAYALAIWTALKGGSGIAAAPKAGEGASTTAASSDGAVGYEDWAGSPKLKWDLKLKTQSLERRNVAIVESTNRDQKQVYRAELPLDKIKGREVTIAVIVKGQNISAKLQPGTGVKLMLELLDAEGGLHFQQTDLPAGSFEWRDATVCSPIPDNIVSVHLVVGLEKVSGLALFGPIRIESKAPVY